MLIRLGSDADLPEKATSHGEMIRYRSGRQAEGPIRMHPREGSENITVLLRRTKFRPISQPREDSADRLHEPTPRRPSLERLSLAARAGRKTATPTLGFVEKRPQGSVNIPAHVSQPPHISSAFT